MVFEPAALAEHDAVGLHVRVGFLVLRKDRAPGVGCTKPIDAFRRRDVLNSGGCQERGEQVDQADRATDDLRPSTGDAQNPRHGEQGLVQAGRPPSPVRAPRIL